jgi:hypothetical protein
MKDSDYNNLIGQVVEILDDEGCVCGKIKIKSYKTFGNHTTFLSEDGKMYDEDEINWSYRLSNGALLGIWILDCKKTMFAICNTENSRNVADGLMQSWLNTLIRSGEIANEDKTKNPKPHKEGDDMMYQWVLDYKAIIKKIIEAKDILDSRINMDTMELLFETLMLKLVEKGILGKTEE